MSHAVSLISLGSSPTHSIIVGLSGGCTTCQLAHASLTALAKAADLPATVSVHKPGNLLIGRMDMIQNDPPAGFHADNGLPGIWFTGDRP